MTFSSDMELDAEQMETVYERLEANNIDVLRITVMTQMMSMMTISF